MVTTVLTGASLPVGFPWAGPHAAANGPGPLALWVWAAAGAAAVLGVTARIARLSGRPPAGSGRPWMSTWFQPPPRYEWHRMVVDICRRASVLHDAICFAQVPGAEDSEDADTGWLSIQQRADELAETLLALRESAHGDARQAAASDVLSCLQALRFAMAAGRAPYAFTSQQAQSVRSHLLSFQVSLSKLRAPGEPLL